MERVAAKFDALLNDPDLDTKFVMGKLQEADQKVATLTAERDAFTSAINSARSQADALYHPQELLKAIAAGDPELRLKLKSEIAKRISRIDLTFKEEPWDVIADIKFINGAIRGILFRAGEAFVIRGEGEA
jgi:hypothetical protein